MNRDNKISEELINAFVDNQMTLDDKEELYSQISENKELNRQVCEIRKVRDLMQTAYRDIPLPPPESLASRNPISGNGWRNIAAAIVLSIGVVVGWQISRTELPYLYHHLASADKNTDPVKILFHLNSDKPESVDEALSEVKSVLAYYKRIGQKARIEFVANGSGLDLLRRDTTTHAKEIAELQRMYPNLRFVACHNTIDRLKREHGITAHLLKGVAVIDSGVAQIMRRQQQGWAYIQV